jgi:hypothetical protein
MMILSDFAADEAEPQHSPYGIIPGIFTILLVFAAIAAIPFAPIAAGGSGRCAFAWRQGGRQEARTSTQRI